MDGAGARLGRLGPAGRRGGGGRAARRVAHDGRHPRGLGCGRLGLFGRGRIGHGNRVGFGRSLGRFGGISGGIGRRRLDGLWLGPGRVLGLGLRLGNVLGLGFGFGRGLGLGLLGRHLGGQFQLRGGKPSARCGDGGRFVVERVGVGSFVFGGLVFACLGGEGFRVGGFRGRCLGRLVPGPGRGKGRAAGLGRVQHEDRLTREAAVLRVRAIGRALESVLRGEIARLAQGLARHGGHLHRLPVAVPVEGEIGDGIGGQPVQRPADRAFPVGRRAHRQAGVQDLVVGNDQRHRQGGIAILPAGHPAQLRQAVAKLRVVEFDRAQVTPRPPVARNRRHAFAMLQVDRVPAEGEGIFGSGIKRHQQALPYSSGRRGAHSQ
ncbi:hypothetical protein PAYE108092_19520 [Paracoccus yeei]